MSSKLCRFVALACSAWAFISGILGSDVGSGRYFNARGFFIAAHTNRAGALYRFLCRSAVRAHFSSSGQSSSPLLVAVWLSTRRLSLFVSSLLLARSLLLCCAQESTVVLHACSVPVWLKFKHSGAGRRSRPLVWLAGMLA